MGRRFSGSRRRSSAKGEGRGKTFWRGRYLHEALEVDGEHRSKLLFTPSIDQDIHAMFLKQISESDHESLHVVIADQAGFHVKEDDPRVTRYTEPEAEEAKQCYWTNWGSNCQRNARRA